MSFEDWVPIQLGIVCTKIGSGATPRGGSEVYLGKGPYALIRSQNVYNDGFNSEGLAYIDEKHASDLSNVEVQPNDVLLNITGDSVARCCQVDTSILPARVNQHVAIIRPNPKRLDPRFLRYFLTSPAIQAKLLSWAGSGGTRNALTKGMIESFEVAAPKNVEEQAAVGRVLGTLDDKIELNRRMNETLEDMVRGLFKSWFVNFDPICAKADGRTTGLPDSIAALFPDSFEESEVGAIPSGWKAGRFGDLVRLLRDQENPAAAPDTMFQHYSIPAHDDGQWPKTERGAEIKSQKFKVTPNVVLVSKLNPEIERVWLVDVNPNERAVCSTEFLVLEPLPPFGRAYIYCLARSSAFRQQIQGLVTGTSKSHQRAQADSVLRLQVVIPPSPLLEQFERFCLPLLQRIAGCRRQSRMMATIRDTLLPKLISGELRVQDAERIVGG